MFVTTRPVILTNEKPKKRRKKRKQVNHASDQEPLELPIMNFEKASKRGHHEVFGYQHLLDDDEDVLQMPTMDFDDLDEDEIEDDDAVYGNADTYEDDDNVLPQPQ